MAVDKTSVITRLISILTLLYITITCVGAFNRYSVILGPWFEAEKTRGSFEWPDGSFSLWSSFWGIKYIDEVWRVIVIAFIPSTFEVDPLSWWQVFSFLVDAGVVYTIWVIEANRVGNKGSAAYFPSIFAQIFQVIGGGIIAPYYYIAHLLTATRAPALTEETRKFDLASMRTLLISVVVTYYVPTIGAFFGPTLESRHWWTWLWQMFPIYIGLSQSLLSHLVPERPIRHSTTPNSNRDWFYVQITVYTLAAFSAFVWLYTFFSAPYGMWAIFIPRSTVGVAPTDLLRTLLQYDHLTFLGAALIWMFWLVEDLQRAGMTNNNLLLEFAGLAGVSIVIGPGATVGLFWLRRELCIIQRTKARQSTHM